MWYLNIPDGLLTHTPQGGKAYLWLINEIVPTDSPTSAPTSSSPTSSPFGLGNSGGLGLSSAATYYMGYLTGGCAGMNELGIITKPVVEECAAACDALPDCVSFEYKRSSTRCQLSSTCNNFSLTSNTYDGYHWYVKVNNEMIVSDNPTPDAYLWLLDNLSGGAVIPPSTVTTTKYYIGYDTGEYNSFAYVLYMSIYNRTCSTAHTLSSLVLTGGCIGRNELGITNKPSLEDCASSCDALSDCVSFEYKRSQTNCMLSSTCNDFSLTVNSPGNSYMWYEKATGYTSHVATGGNAYLWLMS